MKLKTESNPSSAVMLPAYVFAYGKMSTSYLQFSGFKTFSVQVHLVSTAFHKRIS